MRAAKTMLLVIVCFLASWIPLTIKFIVDAFSQNATSSTLPSVMPHLIENLCLFAVHFSSAVDPMIYAFRVKDVRVLPFTGYFGVKIE